MQQVHNLQLRKIATKFHVFLFSRKMWWGKFGDAIEFLQSVAQPRKRKALCENFINKAESSLSPFRGMARVTEM